MIKFFIFVFVELVFLSLSLNAQEAPQLSDKKFKKQAGIMLQKDLDRFTKTLSRDIYVNHWTTLDQINLRVENGPYHLKERKINKYLNKKLKQFKKSSFDYEHAFGNGLYAAPNPISSRYYGGNDSDNWAMIEILIPKGSRFVDTRVGHDKIIIKEATYNFMNKRCRFETFGKWDKDSGTYYGIHKNEFSRNKLCYKILVDSVLKLNINFFSYQWTENMNYPELCDRKGGRYDDMGTSFYLVNINIGERFFNFFMENISDLSVSRHKLNKYKKLQDQQVLLNPEINEDEHGVWQYLSNFPFTKNLRPKVKDTTFGCMKKYNEDKVTNML